MHVKTIRGPFAEKPRLRSLRRPQCVQPCAEVARNVPKHLHEIVYLLHTTLKQLTFAHTRISIPIALRYTRYKPNNNALNARSDCRILG